MKSERFDRQSERYADKVLEARYNYYAALLTVNGFILALFSAEAINDTPHPWLTLALIACAALSILFLLLNFQGHHREYMLIGSAGETRPLPSPEAQHIEKEVGKKRARHNVSRLRAIEGLLAVQIVLIALLVWPSRAESEPHPPLQPESHPSIHAPSSTTR